jgi:hypothetical protein
MEGQMDKFSDIALSQIQRILGFLDRNTDSKSYGCFDRYYWHYKLHDLSNVRFQEGVLALALAYEIKANGNIFYKNKKVLAWAKAGVHFWLKKRHFNGSFDEAYPHEHSFCATSFSTYANTEAILMLKIKVNEKKLARIGKWLLRNDNPAVSNQMAASAIALYNIYLITKNQKFRLAAAEKVNKLIFAQTKSGCFPEYGGYDIGYQTITLSLLAHYYLKTQDKEVYSSLKKGAAFLEGKIRQDGSYNLKGTSRKTQFIYPFGLAVMKSPIVKKLIFGLEKNSAINPAWMDDRYCIQLTNDYLLCDKHVHGTN